MLSRESRLDHTPLEPEASDRGRSRRTKVTWNWERPIMLAAVIAILMLGAIGGMNAITGMFPR